MASKIIFIVLVFGLLNISGIFGTDSDEVEEGSKKCKDSGIACPYLDEEYPVYGGLLNCSEFCQCANGKPFRKVCKPGLHFNTDLNVCDFPYNTNCTEDGTRQYA